MAAPDASQAYGVDAPGVDGRDTSYRANINYHSDRDGLHWEKLRVNEPFNPEVGCLRRSAFDRQFGSLRCSPRPTRSRRVWNYSYSLHYDDIANPGGRIELSPRVRREGEPPLPVRGLTG